MVLLSLCGGFTVMWCFYRCVVVLSSCSGFIVVWWFYRCVVVLLLYGGFTVAVVPIITRFKKRMRVNKFDQCFENLKNGV